MGLSFAEITRVCEEAVKDMLLHNKPSISADVLLNIIYLMGDSRSTKLVCYV